MNISECAFTEAATSGQFVITIYNPLGRPQSPLVVFPVTGDAGGNPRTYTITDPDGTLKVP
jgi:hypothetical protein